MKKYKKTSRKWLNPAGHYDTGAIQWYVENNGSLLAIESGLSIWDCGKKITLSFSAYTEQDLKERARKINILIQELENMRAALGEAFNRIDWQEEDRTTFFIEEIHDEIN